MFLGDSGLPGLNGIPGPMGMKGYVAKEMNHVDQYVWNL